MEHEHIVVTELKAISSRLHSLAKHLEGDHEVKHWERACAEIVTLITLVDNRIGGAGGGF